MLVKDIRRLKVILILILKKKAESRVIEAVMLTLPAPVEERLVHKGTLVKVRKEVGQTEGESIVMVILMGKRGIAFQESLAANTVIQPPLLLVGEHLVG